MEFAIPGHVMPFWKWLWWHLTEDEETGKVSLGQSHTQFGEISPHVNGSILNYSDQ